MSKKTDAFNLRRKVWRNTCKENIIEALGGACCICKYSRFPAALSLHHLDPTQKDFTLSSLKWTPQNWKRVITEIQKCVLVCNNCHSEIHGGFTTVPLDAPRLGTKFATFQEMLEYRTSPCHYCGKFKPLHLTYCSFSCGAKARYKNSWNHVNLLEIVLQAGTYVQAAKILGCGPDTVSFQVKRLGYVLKKGVLIKLPSPED